MSRRTERIGRLMQQVIGRIVQSHLSDPRIEPGLTTVTRVLVQEDLLRAKVYISVMGTQVAERLTIQALQHAAGRIQARLRDEVQLRTMPVLDFLVDEQFKGTLRTWEIIRKAMDEIEAKQPPEEPPSLETSVDEPVAGPDGDAEQKGQDEGEGTE